MKTEIVQYVAAHSLFFYCTAGFALFGILLRMLLSAAHTREIREAGKMGKTKRPWLKQIRLRFETCYRLHIGVPNVAVFVDKHLCRYRFAGIRVARLEHFAGSMYFFCLLSASLGTACARMVGQEPNWLLLHVCSGIWGCLLLALTGYAARLKEKRGELRLLLLDYFENYLKGELEREYGTGQGAVQEGETPKGRCDAEQRGAVLKLVPREQSASGEQQTEVRNQRGKKRSRRSERREREKSEQQRHMEQTVAQMKREAARRRGQPEAAVVHEEAEESSAEAARDKAVWDKAAFAEESRAEAASGKEAVADDMQPLEGNATQEARFYDTGKRAQDDTDEDGLLRLSRSVEDLERRLLQAQEAKAADKNAVAARKGALARAERRRKREEKRAERLRDKRRSYLEKQERKQERILERFYRREVKKQQKLAEVEAGEPLALRAAWQEEPEKTVARPVDSSACERDAQRTAACGNEPPRSAEEERLIAEVLREFLT